MNDLDQLIRRTLDSHAEDAPHAGPVMVRVVRAAQRPVRRLHTPLAVAAVAASIAGVVAVGSLVSGPTPAPVASGSTPPAGTLERCLELGDAALPAEHWQGARVLTEATAGGATRAALVSGDGEQWADCFLSASGEDAGEVSTYPMTPGEPGASEFGFRRADSGPLVFSMLERFPRNVAEVRLDFSSGARYKAQAVDGFVAFQIDDPHAESDDGFTLRQFDENGKLVGGPEIAPGDAALPVRQRSLVPDVPIAVAE